MREVFFLNPEKNHKFTFEAKSSAATLSLAADFRLQRSPEPLEPVYLVWGNLR